MLLGGTFMMHLLEEAFIIIEWHSACAWVAMGAGWMVVWQKQRGKEKEGGGEGGGVLTFECIPELRVLACAECYGANWGCWMVKGEK